MQSLCIISVSVINIGIQSRFAIFQSVTNQDNFFPPYFLNSLHPPPSKSQVHRRLPEKERKERKSWYVLTHQREGIDNLLKSREIGTLKYLVEYFVKIKALLYVWVKTLPLFPEANFPKTDGQDLKEKQIYLNPHRQRNLTLNFFLN